MVFVAQAPADELLGHRGGDLGHLASQLVAGAPDVGVQLGLGGFHEPLRFAASRLDQSPLLLAGLLERLRADAGGLRGWGAGTRLVLLLLPGRRRARGFGPVERT